MRTGKDPTQDYDISGMGVSATGTRDHAPDGFTGHCWVRIDNRYYDPEADWAGWMTGVYGYSSYPIRHYVKKVYNFMR